jgi:hypothetical protein
MDEGLEHLRALEGQVEYFNSLYQSNDKDANDIAELRASCMYEPPVVVRVVVRVAMLLPTHHTCACLRFSNQHATPPG